MRRLLSTLLCLLTLVTTASAITTAPDFAGDGDPWKVTLPANPDDLGDDWEEQTEQAPNRRTFKHKTKKITIHFDKGVEGKPGWAGKDHWHIRNPDHKDSDGKKNYNLDKDGNPVNKGSEKSHIKPGTEVTLPGGKCVARSGPGGTFR